MEKKEVVVESPVAVAGFTIIPVIQLLRNYWHAKGVTSFLGAKEPTAVIVVSPTAKRAFRLTGEEVSIDQLVQEVPGIEEILEGI